MIIYINILLLLYGFLALFLGVNFLYRERFVKTNFKYIVALLSFSASMVCVGYSLMSLSPDMFVAYVFRSIGVIGILSYLLSETILVTNDIIMSAKKKKAIYIIVPLSMLLDIIIFDHPNANYFVRYSQYTSYFQKEAWRHNFHYTYITILFLFMLIIALVWAAQAKLKRKKIFTIIAITSNVALMLSAIPDSFNSRLTLKYPHIPYSIGIAAAFAVFYVAAVRYSAFFITIESISNDIFSNSTTGFVVLDAEGKMSLINDYAGELLGVKYDSSLALQDLFTMQKGYESTVYNTVRLENSQRYRLTAGNTGKNCLVNITVKLDMSSEPVYYLLVVTDLTEEKRLIEEAQAANAAKTTFLSNMSHEIRTPINTISGMNELILRESKDEEILKYAGNIERASRSLLSLINDILDFSKIESGRYEIVPEVYSLDTMIRECCLSANLRIKEKNQVFEVSINPDLPKTLKGDDVRIRQIITNLLSNAIKYTQAKGHIALNVSGDTSDNKLMLCVSIKDDGIGIKKEDIPNLFSAFTRLEPNRNQRIEGTGLGLSIVAKFLKLMDGDISVESDYGAGSVFTVKIPQEIVDNETIGKWEFSEDIPLAPAVQRHSISFKASGVRMLVVDDSPMNIEVILGLLKHTDINIDKAGDGYEALSFTQRNKYDIILMDHMMPGMDGIQVLEKLRSESGNLNINTPVVMITANAMVGSSEEYLRAGFDAYISKPIDPAKLEETVLKFLPENMVVISETNVNGVEEDIKNGMVPEPVYELLNVQSGLEHSAGEEELYLMLVENYIKEDKRQKVVDAFTKEDWDNYRIVVHSIKGTSLTIGAEDVAEKAKLLEQAARERNVSYITTNNESLLKQYSLLIDKLKEVL